MFPTHYISPNDHRAKLNLSLFPYARCSSFPSLMYVQGVVLALLSLCVNKNLCAHQPCTTISTWLIINSQKKETLKKRRACQLLF